MPGDVERCKVGLVVGQCLSLSLICSQCASKSENHSDSSRSGSFERAGFTILHAGSTGHHRRLLGAVEARGLFNFLFSALGPDTPSTELGQDGSVFKIGVVAG
eukprot:627970-Rhodomonas_salina.1